MRFIAGPPEMGGEVVQDTGGFSYRIPPEPIWRKIWRIILGILREVWSKRHNPIQFFWSMIKAAGQLVVLFLAVFAKTLYATIAATAVWLAQKTIKGLVAIKKACRKTGSRISAWWEKRKKREGDELPKNMTMFCGVPVEKRFLWYGFGGIVTIVILVVLACYMAWSFLWWALGIAAAMVGMVVIYYVVKSLTAGSSDETTRKAKEVLALALSLTVALGVINWLLWVLDAELWGSVWATPSRFWAINLGILLAILLLFVAKGTDGKPHPVAKTFSQIIGGLVATILIVSFWDFMTEGKDWSSFWAGKLGDMVSRTQTRVDNKSHSAPMEVALALIADCESGGGVTGAATHFEKDGKTPLKNKEGSTAIGKYQILASAHEKRAKDMGFDINSPEGNEAYARVLYQESGTKHWEGDARSKACWEPKLRAYTWGGDTVSLVVVAPVDRESTPLPTPQKNGGGKFDLSGGGKKYQVRWNVGMPSETLETLPRAKDAPRLQPDVVYNLALKSAEKEPVSVVVKFY
jgi:hypothetical protein